MPNEPINPIKYYELIERTGVQSGQIATAAFIFCGLCGTSIDSMGGPGYGAICEPCGKELLRGSLTSCVVWDEDSTKEEKNQL